MNFDWAYAPQYLIYVVTVGGCVFGLVKGMLTITEFIAIVGSLSLGHATAVSTANKRIARVVEQTRVQAAPVHASAETVQRDPLPAEQVPLQ